MDIETVLYRTANPTHPSREFIAFIVTEADEVIDRKKTGRKVKTQLPVAFYGRSEIDAVARAKTFWNEEKAKARAKEAHGKALGESRRKANA